MASNSNQILIQDSANSDGYSVITANNAFTTKWADKRSATSLSISCSLSGANAPTGAWKVQISDAPENTSQVSYGGAPKGGAGAGTDPVDVVDLTLSGQAIINGKGTVSTNTVTITTTGTTMFQITTSARWIRVVYTPSASVAGLTANVFASIPFQSA